MGALEKARIGMIDDKGGEVGTQSKVMFNPKELTFSKQNNWKYNDSPKANAPSIDFSGGGAMSLKLQLYFDTHGEPSPQSVTTLTDEIHKLMIVDAKTRNQKNKKGRPPYVRFHWGHVVFDGVVSSFSQRLTLFTPDGVPVRAVVELTITQAKDELVYRPQNPTSGGVGGERVWTVRAGDTLPWIAFKEYNDPTEWRPIADANGLTDVRDLRPGAQLVVPNV
jgi:nucleoid-associated protein YgaU